MSVYDDKVLALRKSTPQAGTTDTGESDTGESDTGAPRVSPDVEYLYRLQQMYREYKADPAKDTFSSPAEWLKSRQAGQEETIPVADKSEAAQATTAANYRVTASHMKDPATGDPYAIIETEYDYGVPGGARGTRKIQIGDELPEGSVTNITTEGITVIPPEEGDEFVLPIGHGTAPPPGEKTPKEETPPHVAATEHVSAQSSDMFEAWEKEREDSGGEDPEVPPEVLTAEAEDPKMFDIDPETGLISNDELRKTLRRYKIKYGEEGPHTAKDEPTYWYDEDTDTLEPYERYNRERAQKERREKIRGGLGGNDLTLDAFQPFDAFQLKRPPDPFLTEEEFE